jgi:flagellar FliL protein
MAMADIVEAQPKRGKRPILIGGLLALLLGGAGFYAAISGLIPVMGTQTPGDEHGGDMPAPLAPIAFVSVSPLIVTLGDAAAQRHLRFVSQLEIDPAHAAEVETLLPRIADVMNGYLRAVDSASLEDKAALVRIRAQLLRRIQLVSGEGRVRDLLITEFVLN